MFVRNRIVLIDSDSNRRATISYQLAQRGIHVEPLESAEELRGSWSRVDAMLVEAKEGVIAQSLDAVMDEGNWLPAVGYSPNPQPRDVIRALHEGAVDYVEWPCSPDELSGAVDRAIRDGPRLGGQKLREVRAVRLLKRLSKREREVLSGIADGLSNRVIGDQLSISPRTVEAHRAKMLAKIGVSNTSDAIRVAIASSLVA